MAAKVELVVLGLITVISLLYAVSYITNKKSSVETFKNNANAEYKTEVPITPGTSSDEQPTVVPTSALVTVTPTEVPYEQKPIDDADDYEYNLVYQNESNAPLSKELRNKLMSQYPMHWTGYPPSSSQFQAGLRESFENAKPDVPDDAKPYKLVSGSNMSPPDMSEVEKDERKILQTYKPQFPLQGTTYDVRDANTLIKELYDAKGLVPDVRHKQGTNVYEIIGTTPKNAKVVYEDEEAPASNRPVESAGEGTIEVPYAVNDITTSTKDSFYDVGSSDGDKNMWNYTRWTPGLERVFAPTEPKKDWY
jgi:hypothetical protein